MTTSTGSSQSGLTRAARVTAQALARLAGSAQVRGPFGIWKAPL